MHAFAIFWLVCGLIAAVMIHSRGANKNWVVIGFLLGPIGLMVAFDFGLTCAACGKIVSEKLSTCPHCNKTGADFELTQHCPFCGEPVHQDITECKRCGRVVSRW